MSTTFGVTATTGSRPIAVVAPMCRLPPVSPVNARPRRPCEDPGADVTVPLTSPEATNIALKELRVTHSEAVTSTTVLEALGKGLSTTESRSGTTLKGSTLPSAVLGATVSGTSARETSLLGSASQLTSLPGTTSPFCGLPCSDWIIKGSGSDSGATSRDLSQLDSRTAVDRGSVSLRGQHPCATNGTSVDVVDGAILSLRRCKLDSGHTTNRRSVGLPRVTTTSSSSSHRSSISHPSLTLSLELPQDLLRSVEESNFYYGPMTNTEAKSRLHRCPIGTFLLRDSSDPRFRYSLSVKTSRGTTSIRIAGLPTGHFRLDSDPHQESRMPAFPSILSLVEYYFLSATASPGGSPTEKGRQHRGHCVLLESSGRYDTPMVLRRPLERSPAPLGHLCRRTVNNLLPSAADRRELIDTLVTAGVDDARRRSLHEYLIRYPFRV